MQDVIIFYLILISNILLNNEESIFPVQNNVQICSKTSVLNTFIHKQCLNTMLLINLDIVDETEPCLTSFMRSVSDTDVTLGNISK